MKIKRNVLERKFVPIAFATWYENYPFFQDYFCIIADDKTKDSFYETFFNSIINHDVKQHQFINSVNDDIKRLLQKNTHKLFYEIDATIIAC